MKKSIALLLVAVMCLVFAACGSTETAEAEPQTEETVPLQETEQAPVEEAPQGLATEEPVAEETGDDVVCCVLAISINPEFEVLLNKDGLVLALECLNEDAQNALENSDVIGMAVDEAVVVLLEDIYQYDSSVFPEEQAQVKVTVTMYEETVSISQAIFRMDEAVTGFAESHQIPIAYMRGSAPASEETSTVISDTVDENGNRVIVEVDGDGVEWKTVFVGESTQIKELTRIDSDGTETYCDMETGTTTVTKPDGTTEQMQGVIGKG